jgi:hypothetical protein
MAIKLEMSGYDWYSSGKNALECGPTAFNTFLRDYIGARLTSYNDCIKINIHLPPVVTKSERYSIHRISKSPDFVGSSYDLGDDRLMVLKLSKKFVEELMVSYQFRNDFVVQVEPQVVEKTDKQVLFDTMINFIEHHLQNEFQEFLGKI